MFLGLGKGSFAAKSDFTTGAGCFDVTLADVNGDGTADSVVVRRSGQILVRLGRPGEPGHYAPPFTLNAGDWYAPMSFAVMALVVGLAVAGFVISRGGEPLLGRVLAEEN